MVGEINSAQPLGIPRKCLVSTSHTYWNAGEKSCLFYVCNDFRYKMYNKIYKQRKTHGRRQGVLRGGLDIMYIDPGRNVGAYFTPWYFTTSISSVRFLEL